MAGIALFTAASLAGGLAQSAGWLLAARAAQGVGGAFATPAVLAMITASFADGRERARALGIYTAVAMGGGSLGLVLGGVITEWVSWRWVLFINVPIGIAVALTAPLFLPESPRQPGRFDIVGALTSTAGMTSLVYGFIQAASHGWSDRMAMAAFAAAAVLLAVFLVNESRARQPITPLRLFADRGRSGSYATRLLLVAGMFGMFYFLTQFVQDILGFSLLHAVAGMAWLSRISPGTTYVSGVLGPMLLLGAGMGVAFVPLTMASLAGVRPQDSGAASSMVNVTQQVGGSLGLAILVTAFATATRNAIRHPAAHLTSLAQAPQQVIVHGMASAFTLAAVFDVLALLIVLLVIRDRAPQPAEAPQPAGARSPADA